ncbi:L-serine ammonia-lyase, iron-sulfur-dependent, subunit alpha [Clostridium drakei]|uniref:L-serine dehydratase n=1 Tax=Clostridium drakei TaxID=332101 RepID=A0A2U8DUI6_9CLOT|nr:L-serine ammonia-lyase, iron-sulfur-dependent, subunit alpha [Clostridium drakei]AWI06055.1 L-serine dehydratase, iron-sulfur-dependent subunit alpha [Clostridium drakei]
MNKFVSIFNDVIGPVMTGPSSSHTAGPTRIGKLSKQFLVNDLSRADIYFETKGSFAMTYKGQRSDKGLVGGLLGWEPEDARIINSLNEAKKRRIKISFNITNFDTLHPNTVKLVLTDINNNKFYITGVSTGGGMVELIEFNGYNISICGDFYELILIFNSYKEDYYKTILKILKENYIEPEYVNTFENPQGILINIKLSKELSKEILDKIKKITPVDYAKLISPILPILSRKNCSVPFNNTKEILKYAENENKDLFEAAVFYECTRGNITKEEAIYKMTYILKIMKESIKKGLYGNAKMPYILQHQAHLVKKAEAEGRLINIGVLNKIIYYSMSCMETSSSMGVITAAPTAGSCGIIPGTLISICEEIDLDDESCIKALFCSGLIGALIASHATFAAETCGCQAECGSASCMAAAGIVYLAGGTIQQSITAASIALQNVLGLVCDPVAGLAEIPCMTRNIMAASNAVSCANMALAGVKEVIPLDEVINSMYSVGKMLPRELRCTCLGGLANTKTGQNFSKNLQQIKY